MASLIIDIVKDRDKIAKAAALAPTGYLRKALDRVQKESLTHPDNLMLTRTGKYSYNIVQRQSTMWYSSPDVPNSVAAISPDNINKWVLDMVVWRHVMGKTPQTTLEILEAQILSPFAKIQKWIE